MKNDAREKGTWIVEALCLDHETGRPKTLEDVLCLFLFKAISDNFFEKREATNINTLIGGRSGGGKLLSTLERLERIHVIRKATVPPPPRQRTGKNGQSAVATKRISPVLWRVDCVGIYDGLERFKEQIRARMALEGEGDDREKAREDDIAASYRTIWPTYRCIVCNYLALDVGILDKVRDAEVAMLDPPPAFDKHVWWCSKCKRPSVEMTPMDAVRLAQPPRGGEQGGGDKRLLSDLLRKLNLDDKDMPLPEHVAFFDKYQLTDEDDIFVAWDQHQQHQHQHQQQQQQRQQHPLESGFP